MALIVRNKRNPKSEKRKLYEKIMLEKNLEKQKIYIASLTPEERQIFQQLKEELYEIYKSSNRMFLDKEELRLRRVVAGANLTQDGFYAFMEKKFKRKFRDRPFRREKRVIVNKLFEVISDELLNRDSGVVLDKLGYLAVWVTPIKVRLIDYTTNERTKFMHETNGYFYNVGLFTEVFKNGYRKAGWSMDSAFALAMKRAVFRKVKAGKKYILQYRAVRSQFDKSYGRRLMENSFY